MSDGKVIYEVRADGSKIGKDLDETNKTVKTHSEKLAKTAQAAALGIGTALAAATVGAIKFGSDFEQSLANASTLFGDVDVDMKNLKSGILDLSDESGIAADELNAGLYSALSAGVPITEDASEALEFLELSTKLAKAGFTDVDTAITATAKTLNSYGLDISEAERIQGILIQTQNKGITTVGELGSVLSNVTPTAAAMNIEFEQVGAALANMTAQGTPAAQATTQLNSLLAELGKTGTQAQKALMEAAEGTDLAGMSFQQMNEAGVPLNEILDLLGASAEENGLTMLDMFSSIEAGKAALALAGENSAAFTETLSSMNNTAGLVDETFEKVSNTTKERFNKNLNELKNVLIGLFDDIQKLTNAIFLFIEAVKGGETWIKLLAVAVGTVLALVIAYNVQQALATSGLTLWAAIGVGATAVTTALGAAFAFLTSPIGLIILAIGALIAIGILLVENWDEVKEFLIITWEVIKEVAVEIWEGLKEFFIEMFTAIKDFFIEVWTTIRDFVVGAARAIGDGLKDAFNTAINFVTDKIKGFKTTVEEVIDGIKKVFNNIIDFVKNVFTGNWSDAWDNVKNIFGTVFEGLKSLATMPLNFVIRKINGFLSGLNGIQIPDWVPGIGGKGFSVPLIPELKLAKGGLAFGKTSAIVGDNPNAASDPEVIAPLSKLKTMLGDFSPFTGSNMTQQMFNINLSGKVEVDGVSLGEIMLNNVDEARQFL